MGGALKVRVLTAALLAFAASGALASPVAGAPRTVEITASKLDPAVIVVPPRATVTWRNTSVAARSIAGDDWRSGAIAPRGDFRRRFDRVGVFPYRDAGNADITGTVIVRRVRARSRARRGTVTRRFRAAVKLSLRESWTFRDGRWQSRQGPCNGEVGGGTRAVSWTAGFPRVEYTRVGGLEVLDGGTARPRMRLGVFTEMQDAKSSSSETALVTCPDATTDRAPTQDADCTRRLTGLRFPMNFGWSRSIGLWQVAYGSPEPDPAAQQCGPSYLNSSVLVGLDPLDLPIGLTGNRVLFTSLQARATPGEVARLRAGRTVRVVRAFALRYTTDCCTGFNPSGGGGVYARVGAIQQARAKLTITLKPRR